MANENPTPAALLVEYTNHEGRTALRRILPTGAPYYGTAEPWHLKPDWLLPVRDLDRGVDRLFAISSMYPVHRSGIERMAIICNLDSIITALSDHAAMAVESLRNANNLYRADKLAGAVKKARADVANIGQEILAEARRKIFAPEVTVKLVDEVGTSSPIVAGMDVQDQDVASDAPDPVQAEKAPPETLEQRAQAMEPAVAEFIVRASNVVCSGAAYPSTSLEARALRRCWLKILADHGMDEHSVRDAARHLRGDDLRRLSRGEDV